MHAHCADKKGSTSTQAKHIERVHCPPVPTQAPTLPDCSVIVAAPASGNDGAQQRQQCAHTHQAGSEHCLHENKSL